MSTARTDAFLNRDVCQQAYEVQLAQQEVAEDHADSSWWEGAVGLLTGVIGGVLGAIVGGVPGAIMGYGLGTTTGELGYDYVIDPLFGDDQGEMTLEDYFDIDDAKFYKTELYDLQSDYEALIDADETSDLLQLGTTLVSTAIGLGTDAVKLGSESILGKYMPTLYDGLNLGHYHNIAKGLTAETVGQTFNVKDIVMEYTKPDLNFDLVDFNLDPMDILNLGDK